ALDVRDGARERGQGLVVDVAVAAAADLIAARDDVVAALLRDVAAAAVAELDLAGGEVARVVPAVPGPPAGGPDRPPADPHAAALVLAGGAHRIVAELLVHLARRGLALAHLDDLALEERRLREAERLERRPVGGADDLVVQRLDVPGLHRVEKDADDA